MKATAKAPANIAFIKYWGKADDELRLPLNGSISINLSGAHTITSVEFSKQFHEDSVIILGGTFSEKETTRVIEGLDRIRVYAHSTLRAHVTTQNSFPKGAGSAASASGFAALTFASFSALGIKLPEKELTIFSRIGSGSACRSIPDGFVEWEKGTSSETSYARSLYSSTHWDIRDLLVIVDASMKKVSTSEGMETVRTSPFLKARLDKVSLRLMRCKEALKKKDFMMLGEVVEEDCLDMHHVMQTQIPPLYYWNDVTKEIMAKVVSWRKEGIPVYFTIDAGPNVHILCEGNSQKRVLDKLVDMPGIQEIIPNKVAGGARVIPND